MDEDLASGDLSGLIAYLERESERFRRTDRFVKGLALSVVVLYAVALAIGVAVRHQLPADAINCAMPFIAFVGIGASFSNGHKRAIEVASKLEDPRFIPFLIQAMNYQGKDTAQLAKGALAVRLSRVRNSDDLSPESCGEIARSLKASWGIKVSGGLYATGGQKVTGGPKRAAGYEYQLAALEALSRCGGLESIAPIEEFVETLPDSASGKPGDGKLDRIRVRALQALAEIRLRIAREAIHAKQAETAEILRSVDPSISPIAEAGAPTRQTLTH